MFNKKFSYYLLLIGQVLAGFIILIVVQALGISNSILNSTILFCVFILFNIGIAIKLNIKGDIRSYWSLTKVYFLIIGMVVGLFVAFFPLMVALLTNQITVNDIDLKKSFSVSSLLGTFLIVSWEELWFRGLLLNYCRRKLSVISIAFFMGLLFMLIHILNPKFDILNSGLALFFAGFFLTLMYLHYKNIWLPIGLHFGNNYLQSIVESPLEKNLIFGNDGYLSAIILAVFVVYFILKKQI